MSESNIEALGRRAAVLVLSAGLILPHPGRAQMQVRVEPVRLAPLVDTLPLVGSVVSPRSSQVAAEESGQVLAVHVEIGDRVAEGKVLVALDDEMAVLELERLDALAEEARVQHENAVRLYEEGRRLVEERNIPRTEYETRRATAAALEARLRQLRAQVSAQQLRIERHRIKAPFAGVVGARLTESGQWLAAGAPAVQLVQTDPVRLQARIPERYFSEIRPGTPVIAILDAYPGERIDAVVDSVVAVSEGDLRSFLARMDVPNADHRLAPGMSARLAFQPMAVNAEPVLQVPADAIVRRTDGTSVVWLVRDGAAIDMPVTVGRRSGAMVEIRGEGVRAGERAVIMGNEDLRRGQAVTGVDSGPTP